MRGHIKFLGGFEKIEGARLSGGLLQRGVSDKHGTIKIHISICPCGLVTLHVVSLPKLYPSDSPLETSVGKSSCEPKFTFLTT